MIKNTDPALSIKRFMQILTAFIEVHPQPISIYHIIIKSGLDTITPNQHRMYQRIMQHWTKIGILKRVSTANTTANYYYLSEAGEYFIGSLRTKENKNQLLECFKHKGKGYQSIDFRFFIICHIAIENDPHVIDSAIVTDYIQAFGVKQCRRTWQRNLKVCLNGGLLQLQKVTLSSNSFFKLDPIIKSSFFEKHKHPQIMQFEKIILQSGLCLNFHEYINYNNIFFLNLWKTWRSCKEKFYIMIENIVDRKEIDLAS